MKKLTRRLPLFEVRHSRIHGYGVFAARRIRKGTTVIEYLGDRVSHDEADARYEDKDPTDNHTFLFTVDSKTVIDGGVDGNEARYINHGCDPNCASTARNKRIYVEAIRTIQAGEELAYDYQIDRDPDDPPNVDEIFACRCGAAQCRGSMLVARRKLRKSGKRRPAAGKAARKGQGQTAGEAERKGAGKAARREEGRAAGGAGRKVAGRAVTRAAVLEAGQAGTAGRAPKKAGGETLGNAAGNAAGRTAARRPPPGRGGR